MSLVRHPKFLELKFLLKIPACTAAGILELMWASAHERDSDSFTRERDIELVTEFDGQPGTLAPALVEAGFLKHQDGKYLIHDYLDHAPEWVKKRNARRTVADSGGQCPTTADNGGQRRTTADSVRQRRQEKRREEKPSDLTAEPRGIDYNRKERANSKDDATPISARLDSALGGLHDQLIARQGSMIQDIIDITGPEWQDWTIDAITKLDKSGGIPPDIPDTIDRIRDSRDPTTASRKDIGQFSQPDKFLVKAITDQLKARKQKWRDFPR